MKTDVIHGLVRDVPNWAKSLNDQIKFLDRILLTAIAILILNYFSIIQPLSHEYEVVEKARGQHTPTITMLNNLRQSTVKEVLDKNKIVADSCIDSYLQQLPREKVREVCFFRYADIDDSNRYALLKAQQDFISTTNKRLSDITTVSFFGFSLPAPKALVLPIWLAIALGTTTFLILERIKIGARIGYAVSTPAFMRKEFSLSLRRGLLSGQFWIAPIGYFMFARKASVVLRNRKINLLLNWSTRESMFYTVLNWLFCMAFAIAVYFVFIISRKIFMSPFSSPATESFGEWKYTVGHCCDIIAFLCWMSLIIIATGTRTPSRLEELKRKRELRRSKLLPMRRGMIVATSIGSAFYVLHPILRTLMVRDTNTDKSSKAMVSPTLGNENRQARYYTVKRRRSRLDFSPPVSDGIYSFKQNGKLHLVIHNQLLDYHSVKLPNTFTPSELNSINLNDINNQTATLAIESRALHYIASTRFEDAENLLRAALNTNQWSRSKLRLIDLYAKLVARRGMDKNRELEGILRRLEETSLTAFEKRRHFMTEDWKNTVRYQRELIWKFPLPHAHNHGKDNVLTVEIARLT